MELKLIFPYRQHNYPSGCSSKANENGTFSTTDNILQQRTTNVRKTRKNINLKKGLGCATPKENTEFPLYEGALFGLLLTVIENQSKNLIFLQFLL